MTNYIDKDKLIRDLIDNRNFYPAIVKNAIEHAPTEDVVPRSEVEKWYAEYHKVKEDLKQEKMYHKATEKLADKYLLELKQAKQEVARKIFEDFTKHKVCTNEEDYRVLAELKKKYIGE